MGGFAQRKQFQSNRYKWEKIITKLTMQPNWVWVFVKFKLGFVI